MILSKYRFSNWMLIFWFFFGLWVFSAGIPTLTLAPAYARGVDGLFEIPVASGIVVNGESRLQHIEETRALHLQGARLYLWPMGANDINKKGEAFIKQFMATDFDKEIPLIFDKSLFNDPEKRTRSGKGISAQFWQLEQLQMWNIRQGIVLQIAQPHPRGPEDFAQYGKFYRACLREVKKRFPDLGPLMVMTFNEPDYEYPRNWDKRNLSDSVKLFMDLHNFLKEELSKEFPEVTLVGPGISKFMGWTDWENWTLPFLKQVSGEKVFNCQPYTSSQEDLLAWASMLKAESLLLNQKPLPLLMTEANSDLQPAAKEWWVDEANVHRVHEEAEALFTVMSRPDLFYAKYYFYYHYNGGCIDMWFKGPDGTVRAAPVYWLYYLTRDLRGKRVFAEIDQEAAKEFACVAALTGNDLALAIHNKSAVQKKLNLKLLLPLGLADTSVLIESYRFDEATKKFVFESLGLPTAPGALNFTGGEIKKLRWTFSPTQTLLTGKINETEVMARGAALTVKSGKDFECEVAASPAKDHSIRTILRAGLYLDDPLSVQEIGLSVNGVRFKITANTELFGKRSKQPIEWVEIWLPPEIVKEKNSLIFEAPESGAYRMMSVSLSQLAVPEGVPLWIPDLAKKAAPENLKLNLAMAELIGPGETAARLKVFNPESKPKTLNLLWHLPAGWKLSGQTPSRVSLAAGESLETPLSFVSPEGLGRAVVNFSVEAGGPEGASTKARRGAFFQIPLEAEYAENAPALDGSLSEWNPKSFITVHHSGPSVAKDFDTRLAAKWDHKNLYLAFVCTGRVLNPPPPGKLPWSYDVAELFLDFPFLRSPRRDHRNMQVWTPLRSGSEGFDFNHCPNDPNGVFLKAVPVTSDKGFVKEVSGESFVCELSYNWESMTGSEWTPANERFVPKAGQVLGCEFALANRSLLGGLAKEWDTPANWGMLKLLEPGKKGSSPSTPINPLLTLSSPARVTNGVESFHLKLLPGTPTDAWILPKGVETNGMFRLGNVAQTVLFTKEEEPGFFNPSGMTMNLGLIGFEPDLSKVAEGKNYTIDLRCFVSPSLPKGYIEPHSLRDCVLLKVSRVPDGASVSVFVKENADKGGFGQILCEGKVKTFPAKISLWLDASHFRLSSDQTIQVTGGALSGSHNLTQKIWEGKLSYGVKSVYGDPAFALLSEFSLQSGVP